MDLKAFCLYKKPSGHRYSIAALLVMLVVSSAQAKPPEHAPPLTEKEAIARALQRPPLQDVLTGKVAAEEGREQAGSAVPNPQISYMREQTFGPLGSGEDYLSLAQTLDFSGRRALRREAGKARVQASQKEGDAVKLDIVADARERFYEVLYRQERLKALEAWALHVGQALEVVTRREKRGDAAAFDRRRIEREQAVASARLETERAALERVRAKLEAVLGGPPAVTAVTGNLLPENDPMPLSKLRAAGNSRPDMIALHLRAEAASLDQKAFSRWWMPDIRLEAGWKGVQLSNQGRTDGFLAGVSLSIPLWDQSSGLARMAEGESQALRGQHALLVSEADGELAGAHAETLRLRRAALDFRRRSAGISADLIRIALAGYEGGEMTLLELLDAYRGAADDALTALDLDHAARLTRIELDQRMGAGLP